MQSLYESLVTFHQQNPHLLKALLAGTLVSTVCGVIGCFIVLRRTSFLADAVAHSMLAGVVCGYLFMKRIFHTEAHAPAMLIGAVLAGFFTVAMVTTVSRFSRVKEDALIGIMYTGVFAFGGLLLSLFSQDVHIDLYHFIVGQLLGVGDTDLWMMAFVAVVVFSFVILTFRSLQLITFDRVMAASIGINVLALDYMLTTCTSLVVVSGVHVVGVILVVGLLITPAATAYLLCDRLTRMLPTAAFFGWTSFLVGYLISEKINVAPGSAVVVASAAQFLLVFLVAPRYGLAANWLRRRRSVPQQLVEDVLGCVLRSPEATMQIHEVVSAVTGRDEGVRKAIRWLQRQELAVVRAGNIKLTESGEIEGRRLLRAHRLWETYLQHLGMPEDQLHQQAHLLEHLHDEEAVDYLDDKLGHPLQDPHGSEIPEDFVHLVPGEPVKAALLREGHQAEVIQLAGEASATKLQVGMTIKTGPREEEGAIWTFQLPDGDVVRLDHETVDLVKVRLLD